MVVPVFGLCRLVCVVGVVACVCGTHERASGVRAWRACAWSVSGVVCLCRCLVCVVVWCVSLCGLCVRCVWLVRTSVCAFVSVLGLLPMFFPGMWVVLWFDIFDFGLVSGFRYTL